MLPRKCGPASFQVRRVASLARRHSPLRVATSKVTPRGRLVDVRRGARVAIVGPRAQGSESRTPYRAPQNPATGGVEFRAQDCDSVGSAIPKFTQGACMTIKVGDKLPAGKLSEFIEVET